MLPETHQIYAKNRRKNLNTSAFVCFNKFATGTATKFVFISKVFNTNKIGQTISKRTRSPQNKKVCILKLKMKMRLNFYLFILFENKFVMNDNLSSKDDIPLTGTLRSKKVSALWETYPHSRHWTKLAVLPEYISVTIVSSELWTRDYRKTKFAAWFMKQEVRVLHVLYSIHIADVSMEVNIERKQ